jgi:vancomycin resistance protein VanJ
MSTNPPDPTRELVRAGSAAAESIRRSWRNRVGRWVAWLTWCYIAALGLLLSILERGGERHWMLSLLLFVPPQAFLAPLLLLAPLALCVRPRLLIWQLGAVAFVAFGYMTFRWTPRPVAGVKPLVVVTHNVGQGNRPQFAAFLGAEKPEVMVLQDAKFRGAEYTRRFPEFYVAGRGEFFLLSRDLIQQAVLLEEPKWRGHPVAARFEIVHDGHPLVIYNVHMPTPRPQFNQFLSRRVVRDLFGEEEGDQPFKSYRQWLDARVELARGLARVLASEQQPFLACGDFNMPDHGEIYHFFSSTMTDGFVRAGRGWGLTFPGETRNPVAFFDPWLRIDFAFAGHGWKPLFCEAEPGRKSQHRAVVAYFVPIH